MGEVRASPSGNNPSTSNKTWKPDEIVPVRELFQILYKFVNLREQATRHEPGAQVSLILGRRTESLLDAWRFVGRTENKSLPDAVPVLGPFRVEGSGKVWPGV